MRLCVCFPLVVSMVEIITQGGSEPSATSWVHTQVCWKVSGTARDCYCNFVSSHANEGRFPPHGWSCEGANHFLVAHQGKRRKEMSIDRQFKKHSHLPWLLQQFKKNNNNRKIPDQSRGWIYEFDFHANSALNMKWVVKWNLKGSCSVLLTGAASICPELLRPRPLPARHSSWCLSAAVKWS